MNNILIELEKNKIEHFIIKSHITCPFEEDDHRTEYHVYHKIDNKKVGKWNSKDERYPYLKVKKLQKREIKYFRSVQSKYKIDLENQDGTIFINKLIGFQKENPCDASQGLL